MLDGKRPIDAIRGPYKQDMPWTIIHYRAYNEQEWEQL
jgi:hypothetical protein